MADKNHSDPGVLIRFLRCEAGATAIEYAMIAAATFLGLVPLISNIGDSLLNKYQNIGNYF